MKKYLVQVCNPTDAYVVEARSEKEAKRKAVKLYKKEQDTWIDPEIHRITEK